MTHLRIEQNNGVIEEVSSSIITKLYEIAHAGLDVSSNLLGRLHTPISYREHVQYLTTNYPNLYILSDNYAIPFEDPNIVTYLNSIGVGSNGMITEPLAAAATIVANSLNTQVTKFNELRYFTNITQSKGGWTGNTSGYTRFINWTALEEVDISNFTSLGHVGGASYEDTFCGCTVLKTVTASDKLIRIGHNAFFNCTNLEHIIGLSGTIQISNYAFYNCSKLPDEDIANVEFEPAYDGTDLRGNEAFKGTNFTEITFSPNTTIIPLGMFENCSNLETVSGTGSNITKIYPNSFSGCTSLTTIAGLSNNVELINTTGNYFKNCNNLAFPNNFSVLNSNNTIGNSSFYGCHGLTSITLASNITTLKDSCFYDCNNLTAVNNSENITTINGNAVFYKCSSLIELNLSNVSLDSPDSFCKNIFGRCTNLEKVILGDCIALGNSWAGDDMLRPHFMDCTSLHTVDVKSLQSVPSSNNANTFYNCPAMQNFIIRSSVVPSVQDNGNVYISAFGGSNVKIYVPDAAVNDYKNATGWSNVASYIYPLSDYQP